MSRKIKCSNVIKRPRPKNYINKYIKENNKKLRELSIEYRDNLINRLTLSEKVFEKFLIDNKLNYQKQYIIHIMEGKKISHFYIADFYLPYYNLIIEIDGGYHNEVEQIEKDKIRDITIRKKLKCKIFRFKNNDVYDNYKIKSRFKKYLNLKLK